MMNRFDNRPIVFSQGPQLAIDLAFAEGRFKCATLSFSKRFECRISGTPQALQREQLLHFLECYGKREIVALDLPLEHLSPFKQKVLTHLQAVPLGATLTYGELAEAIDHPRAARAVGTTCRLNPFPVFIPCHRVIASGGKIGGFAYDIRMKNLLLDFESL